ncbi:hypothetical protein GJ496_007807 [Pomphorhynchus laevis]|nr:hypothetical protein GJ496_007807 [Pomphorhynchus laevis]
MSLCRPAIGRPIVNCIGATIEMLSKRLHQLTFPLAKQVNGYIGNTTKFLNKLNEVNKNILSTDLLITMDVESLYPSIPHADSLNALNKAMTANNWCEKK